MSSYCVLDWHRGEGLMQKARKTEFKSHFCYYFPEYTNDFFFLSLSSGEIGAKYFPGL